MQIKAICSQEKKQKDGEIGLKSGVHETEIGRENWEGRREYSLNSIPVKFL
jgi:hypothetical protein